MGAAVVHIGSFVLPSRRRGNSCSGDAEPHAGAPTFHSGAGWSSVWRPVLSLRRDAGPGRRAGIPPVRAPLLPIAVDVGAAVFCPNRLSIRLEVTARFAHRMAWSLGRQRHQLSGRGYTAAAAAGRLADLGQRRMVPG